MAGETIKEKIQNVPPTKDRVRHMFVIKNALKSLNLQCATEKDRYALYVDFLKIQRKYDLKSFYPDTKSKKIQMRYLIRAIRPPALRDAVRACVHSSKNEPSTKVSVTNFFRVLGQCIARERSNSLSFN